MLVFLLSVTASFASDTDSMKMNETENVLSANGIAEEIQSNAEMQNEIVSASDYVGDVQGDTASQEDVLMAESNDESDLQSQNDDIISAEGNSVEIDSEANDEIIGVDNHGDTLGLGTGGFHELYDDVYPFISIGRNVTLERDYANTDHYASSYIISVKDHSFTIDGDGHTIDFCKYGLGFHIERAGNYNVQYPPINVTIKNINFINYTTRVIALGNNPGYGGINLQLINCNFTNPKMEQSTQSLGVIDVIDIGYECSILIKDCNFINGSSNSIPFKAAGRNVHYTLENCAFKNFYTKASSSSLYRGGLIVSDGGSKEFNIYNCTFENMYTYSSPSVQNDEPQAGGVIFMTVGNPIIRIANSSFVNCTTERGNGGALYVGPKPGSGTAKNFVFNVSIDNSSFVNSSAGLNGGAVYIGGYSGKSNDFQASVYYTFNLNVTNSSFINNRAKNGGAICIDTPWIGTIGTYQGHNFNALPYVNITLNIRDNCVFEDNSVSRQTIANSGGGAIYIGYTPGTQIDAYRLVHYRIDLNISNNCSFTNNSATVPGARNSGGGAICIDTHANVTITNTSFENNTVKVLANSYQRQEAGGGAIFIGKLNDENETIISNLLITDVSFINNGVTGLYSSGGAIFVKDASKNEIYDVIFEGNSIEDKYGTALYFQGASENNIYNVTFKNNIGIKNALGGALSFANDTLSTIENSSFINNTLTSNNGAGGAVHYRDDSGNGDSTFINIIFEDNSANSGGAVYIGSAWNDIKFVYSNFTNNSGYNGGVFYLYNSSAIINNGRFNQNRAGKNGGSAYLNGGQITVTESEFENNHANKSGGAIYVNMGHIDVTNVDFEYNSANKSGGAIYLFENNTATIDNANFKNNSANYLGGAVFIGIGSNTTIDHSVFTNNSAFMGSAINYQAETGVTSQKVISNSVFFDNLANSTRLIAVLDRITNSIEIEYTAGDNYLNAIKSYDDLEFHNVSYYEYGLGNKNTDDGVYVKTYQIPYQEIIVDYLDENGNVLFSEAMTTDDLGKATGHISVPEADKIRAVREGDAYYTLISTELSNKIGDFDLIQLKIMSTAHGGVLEFDRDYVYTLGLDTMTEGIKIDRPITINGKGFSIDALFKSRVFNVLSDNVTFINLTFYNSTKWNGSFICGINVSNINITNCTFDNSANFDELLNPTPVELDEDDDRIHNPHTSTNGCAVYLEGNNSMTVNSTFTHLVAGNGAGMYIDGINHIVTNTSFDNVVAENSGAAIYALGEQFMINATVVNATAGVSGGAIFANANYFLVHGNFTNCTGGVNASDIQDIDKYLVDSIMAGQINNTQIGGGAIFFDGNILYVYNSDFINCTSSTFGGAIHANGQNIYVVNSNFTNSSALSGGGLFVDLLSYNVNIDNCIFENNSAFNNGGAASLYGEGIQLSNSTFDGNIQILNPNERNGGGAIYWFGANGNIVNCNFTNNRVAFPISNPKYDPYGHEEIIWYGDWGDVVWVEPDFNKYITELDLNNQTMVDQLFAKYSSGGAILIRTSGINIDSCLFDSNFAQSGGAIAIYPDEYGRQSWPNVQISNSNFTNNFAQFGGAILDNFGNDVIYACDFTNNSAYVGGALSLQGNDTYMEYLTFRNNGAVYGGALVVGESAEEITSGYWDGGDWIEYTEVSFNGNRIGLFNSTFIDNGGYYGGAVLWLGSDGSIGENCHFINNSYDKGYEYYADGFERCYLMNISLDNFTAIKDDPYSYMTSNPWPELYQYLVEGYGGAVYWAGTDGQISNTEFTGNRAPNGGALFVYPIGETVVPMISTDPNVQFQSTITIDGCNFTKNTAEMGSGGAVIVAGSFGDIMNSQFIDNHASMDGNYTVSTPFSESRGGAILWFGHEGGVTDSVFVNNSAEYGGAISWCVIAQAGYASANGYMSRLSFENNTATYGGAIYNEGENMYMEIDLSFTNNSAANGGAIYNEGDNLYISGAVLTYNNATEYGGAVYNTGKEFSVMQSQFLYNKANTGSAIYTSGYIYLEDCSLANNQAHAALVKITSSVTDGINANITAIFKGNDNLMNAIYAMNAYDLYNVYYWGADGPTNSDDVWPVLSDLEAGMNLTFTLTSIDDPTVQYSGVVVTNIDGEATYTINGVVPGRYIVEVVHYEDDYYTEEDTVKILNIGKILPTIRITSEDIFYKENETVKVQINRDATGNVTISIDGIINVTVNITKGFAVLENISGLAAGIYNVTVYYPGDEVYSNSSVSTRFVVKQLNSTISITTFNETEDAMVPFKVILGNDDDMTGTIFITVEDQFGVTFTVNSTNEFEGIIFGLPNGKYNVSAYYTGDNNYLNASNFTSFTITNATVANATIDVKIADIAYLENATAYIRVSGKQNGNVTVKVDDKTFTGKITNGTGVVVLTGLSAGVKTAIVNFTNEVNGANLSATTKFVVHKAQSAVEISVDGKNVKVNVINGTSGNLTVYINGIKNEVAFDGSAITFSDVLVTGNNTIIAFYSGNENYTDSQNTKNVFITKKESTVNVTAKSIIYGEDAEIIVTVGEGQTGLVTINVDNKIFTAEIKNGGAKFMVPGLNVDKYNVTVVYAGDNNYESTTNNTTFIVKKADLTALVVAENVTVNDNSSFIIYDLPSDFKGMVNITVDGITYSGSPDAIIKMAKLTAGDKKANVVFYGDPNYNDLEVNVTFTVSKTGVTAMIVEVNNVVYGNNATAIVTVSGMANGTVVITVNGKTYNAVNVVNGNAQIDLGVLSAGIKNVTAEFTVTDSINNDAVATTKFVVDKAPSTVDITVDGENVKINVVGGTSGILTVYINGIKYEKAFTGEAVVISDVLITGDNSIVAIYGGNENYTGSNSAKNASISKKVAKVNVTAKDITYGSDAEIIVAVGEGQTGYVTIVVDHNPYTSIIKNGKALFEVPGLKVAKYDVDVTYLGNENYTSQVNSTSFNVNKADLVAQAIGQNVTIRDDAAFVIIVPDDFTGKVNITVDGKTYSGSADTLIKMGKLSEGNKVAKVVFWDDPNYNDLALDAPFTVSSTVPAVDIFTVKATNMKRGWNSEFDYEAAFLNKDGTALVNATIKFVVNGKTYTAITDKDGIGHLTDSKLAVGTYEVTSINTVTNEQMTTTLNIVKRITENKDIVMDYRDGTKFVVKVFGDDGNIAPEGEIISIYANGIHYVAKVDSTGHASLSIKLLPKTYTIIAEYKGYQTKNTLKVKQILKVAKKTIKVKKSVKTIKIKATLKYSNGKALKGKKITFHFKGKFYKAKTNKKGVAIVKIKKKSFKNLKKGKKYKVVVAYTVRENYGKDIVTISDRVFCYVKVKK